MKCHEAKSPGAPLTYFNDGGVRRIFLGLTFWPKGIFLGLWETPGFFWVAKTTEYTVSAIYSFVFDQKQSWSWHVLAFQKLNNKICWCKNTEGFFWVDKFWSRDFFGYKIWTYEWGPWGFSLMTFHFDERKLKLKKLQPRPSLPSLKRARETGN